MNRRERLQEQIIELQQEWKYLTNRLRGVQQDLVRTMDGERLVILEERLNDLKNKRAEIDAELDRLEQELQQVTTAPSGQRVFISYKRHSQPDETVAMFLARFLNDQGRHAFIDQKLKVGMDWVDEIRHQITQADFLVVLLSPEAVRSEMVLEEVRFADQQWRETGRPRLLPIRLDFEDSLPYPLDEYLAPLQYLLWQGEGDTSNIAQRLLNAMTITGDSLRGGLELPSPPSRSDQADVDGPNKMVPAPDFDPRSILEAPGGAVDLESPFYIKRRADEKLERELLRSGTTTTIRAARQMGKTSLLVRGVEVARQQGYPIIFIDFQMIDAMYLKDLDGFLHYLALNIASTMEVEFETVEAIWRIPLSSKERLSHFLEKQILSAARQPIILAIDEADWLFKAPFRQEFFSLIRAWFSRRTFEPLWKKLNVAMVISTQPYLLIDDIDQSPFNVGLTLHLEDFTPEQVRDLNERHGSPLNETELTEIIAFLGGHPYLIRQAFYTLVDTQISWPKLITISTQPSGPFNAHLVQYLWRLREQPELLAAFKEILSKQTCTDEIALIRLTAVGLVKQDEAGHYHCRCQLYDRYFRQHLR